MPGFAARPLLDQHQWDAYFGLYARDVNVPWKATTVRLDTYSGAPVDFAAYNVDPADVIVAGQNSAPRAIDTGRLRPVVRWRFSPPPGYHFESSDVPVPLGAQEGFYVVEARRGAAVQQVWLNRTHVGLVVTQRPAGLVLWAVDLHNGRALTGMSVDFLLGLRLVRQRTDRNGLIVWRGRGLPTFALAESGASRAFVSMLPQAPAPAGLVGIRLESGAARAGTSFRFVGFARRRIAGIYRRATGDVRITLLGHGSSLASIARPLDAAGAFTGELAVPSAAASGDYAVLASASGGVGGTTLHVDASSDVALEVVSTCPCDPDRDVPLGIVARRGDAPAAGVSIHVRVVRSPHVLLPGFAGSASWGTTVVYDRTLSADDSGRADVVLSSPSDGLDSTYGVSATAAGASADARIVVPNAKVALALAPLAPSAGVGDPVAFAVRAFDPVTGSPVAGLPVRVELSHGASAAAQTVTLDERGRAKAIFHETNLGSNLALASATVDGRQALDAADVLVEPSAVAGQTQTAAAGVALTTDRPTYGPRDRVTVRAVLPGASGDGLLVLSGADTFAPQIAAVEHGAAQATVALADPQGSVNVAAAFVRDGAIALGETDVPIDGPGRAVPMQLVLDKPSYDSGETLHATLHAGAASGGATFAIRIADGPESAPAYFEDAPDLLGAGAAGTQAPASDDPQWHAYVAPARSKANDIFAAERPRQVGDDLPAVVAAAPRTLYWSVERGSSAALDIPVPSEPGHFVLSVMRIADNGDLGAASAGFDVR